jgi:NAD(P)-dependent dehydrogenase (short-subunit alcohol dehydrogenase family)
MKTDLFDLSGKVALVTGGSRGLGYQMVMAFARQGADVVIASRKLDACVAVGREVEALGRRALPVACHVGDWAQIDALVEAAYAHFGRIDILVNNAGMSPLAPSSVETSEALFDKVVGVNFKGPFRLTAQVGSRMVRDGGGSIIMVSSTGALRPSPSFATYAASKAALNSITTSFALEYGPSVRVNCISAGPFLTDIAKAWGDPAQFNQGAALARAGRPEEIVTTALYLASDHSSYTSNALIKVDGGLAP